MPTDPRVTRTGLAIAGIAIAAGAVALWLFPKAIPVIALEQRVTRQAALTLADSVFRAHDLAPAAPRRAVRFGSDDSLRIFVELGAGGKDSLDALVRGRDVSPFAWSVRAFDPKDVHEAQVHFAPDGRFLGFSKRLAEADTLPAVSADSGRTLADRVLADWLGEPAGRWRIATSSYETRKTSGRVDRTYTFERTDRKVGGAPIRLDVVIGGNAPISARRYVVIPEAFSRRYDEMRSANELLSLFATVGIFLIAIAAAVALYRFSKQGLVRWREPWAAGVVLAILFAAAGLNGIGLSWYDYDTATSPGFFEMRQYMGAVLAAVFTGGMLALTLAAAEVTTRRAFPAHLDWWKLWRERGSAEVAGRVFGGYAGAAFAMAYVALFYVVTRNVLGWWVPSEILDDPNQVATPMPWITGIAISLQAGVWEEALFRALPLSMLALWVGDRPKRAWWMAGGVVVTALVFGFAHASYASWPPYSRGVEIFLDACLWGVLFLRYGLLITVVAHFAYDLVLFGLFAAMGSAIEYRISAAIILLALFAPALAVAWRWVRQRRLTAASDDARFAAWSPAPVAAETTVVQAGPARVLGPRARVMAMVVAVAGVLAAVTAPAPEVRGPRFTATRDAVLGTADSVLRATGGDPAAWRRFSRTATDTLEAWPRFLRENKQPQLATDLARTYAIPAWWVVRYVRTAGTGAERAEEWRVRLHPDGAPLDVRHILPESARRDSPGPEQARRIARAALVRAGFDTLRLHEAKFDEVERPARKDVTITYTDSAVRLPGDAAARVWVTLAGDEPLVVRRGIELPERFLREHREREERRLAMGALGGLAIAGFIITAAIVVIRRRPPLVIDRPFSTRAWWWVVGVLWAGMVVSAVNSLPTDLYSYDTATPWSNFVTSTAITGLVASIIGPAFVVLLWLGAESLRKRVGIPVFAAPEARGGLTATVVAGLGLGAFMTVTERAGSLVRPDGIPGVPSTTLDQALPALGDVAGIPSSIVAVTAILAIPILAIAGLTRRRGLRVLYAVVLVAIGSATAASAADIPLKPDALATIIGLGGIAGTILAFRAWATISSWSWIVAALTSQLLSSVRQVVQAPTGPERAGGLVALLGAGALLALAARRAAKQHPSMMEVP